MICTSSSSSHASITIGVLLLFLFTGCATTHTTPQYSLGPLPSRHIAQQTIVAPKASPQPTKIIFVDPGHGGRDPGTQMRKWPNLKEKTLTLEVAKQVEQQLTTLGYCVAMSRRSDSTVSLQRRVVMAGNNKASVFVSIHINSCPNKRISGAEIFYYSNPKNAARTKSSQQLAQCLCKRFSQLLPIRPRGVKTGNFCVIRETAMPAVLIETAFITNAGEARLLSLPSFKTKLAVAIAKGIDDYVHSK